MEDITSRSLLNIYLENTEPGYVFSDDIVDYARLIRYTDGEMICERDQPMTRLIFLLEGMVKVFIMLENGRAYILGSESPISVYGEVEMLDESPYSASVEAIGSCLCLVVPITYIRRNCLSSPEFLKYVIRSLARRLEKISYDSTNNLLLPLKSKLARYLLLHRKESSNSVVINMSLNELAEQMGATYRHLSRVMKAMEDKGLIKREGKEICILAIEGLILLTGDLDD